jgi:hypothetical protein
VVEIQAREATAGIDLGHHSLIVAGGGEVCGSGWLL